MFTSLYVHNKDKGENEGSAQIKQTDDYDGYNFLKHFPDKTNGIYIQNNYRKYRATINYHQLDRLKGHKEIFIKNSRYESCLLYTSRCV